MDIVYKLKAQFYPAAEGQGEFIGSAAITVADAIMLRGIAVFRDNVTQDLVVSFPTFGKQRQSYILPLNRTAYNHIVSLIENAVKEIGFRSYEEPGSTDIALSVTGNPADMNPTEYKYSLTIPDFCRLNGITTQEMPYTLPNGQKVAVRMPSLQPPTEQGSEGQIFTVFHGLLRPKTKSDGTQVLQDYQEVIDNLVREKRVELIQKRDHAEIRKQEGSILLPNQTIR